MAGEGTMVMAFVAILLGLYFHQFWLSMIFVAAILAVIATSAPALKPKAVPRGPIVRPVIVKRHYVGPPSIYPEKMKIKVSDKPDDWYEYAGEESGKFLGIAAKFVKDKLFGKGG